MKTLKFEVQQEFLETVCFFDETGGWTEFITKAKAALATKLKVKGFREGKVPTELVDQYVKSDEILAKAIRLAQESAIQQLLKTKKDTLVNKYRLFDVKVEKVSFSECQFLLKWQKLPTVKVSKWNDFQCSLKPTAVTRKEVEDKIAELKNYFATFVEIDQPVTKSSYVLIDYEGKVDDKVNSALTAKGLNYQFGESKFGSQFDQALLGMEKGATKSLTLTLAKDYPDSKLAQKKVTFSVQVVKVQAKKLPQSSELAGMLKMEKIQNLTDLEKLISESIAKTKTGQMHQEVMSLVWPKVIAASTFDIPQTYLETEFAMLKSRQLEELKQQKKTLAQFLKEQKITEKQFEAELKEKVRKTLSDYLLVTEIASLAKITVSDQEIEDYYQFLSKNQNKKLDEVKSTYSKPLLFNNLLRFRVEDFLVKNTFEFNRLLKEGTSGATS